MPVEGLSDGSYLPASLTALLSRLSGSSLLKFLLSESEKVFCLSIPPASSGAYTMISNLGSYIPRYLFAPIETVSFSHFASDPSQQASHRTYLEKMTRLVSQTGLVLGVYGWVYCG